MAIKYGKWGPFRLNISQLGPTDEMYSLDFADCNIFLDPPLLTHNAFNPHLWFENVISNVENLLSVWRISPQCVLAPYFGESSISWYILSNWDNVLSDVHHFRRFHFFVESGIDANSCNNSNIYNFTQPQHLSSVVSRSTRISDPVDLNIPPNWSWQHASQ